MNVDRKAILTVVSEMLDNPDPIGIYPTTKAYDALEKYVEKVRLETLGWATTDACTHLDENIDYRQVEVPGIIERALKDLDVMPEEAQ